MILEENGITLEAYLDKNTDIICVFGCLLTDAGKKIKQEMLDWILPKYDCFVVNQEAPGKLFEFPGLVMAKKVSIMYNKPVLYLHTKGAAHSTNVYNQVNCRLVWKDEFINHYDEYYNEVNKDKNIAKVLCPFCGTKQNTTILNGFIANEKAWRIVNIPNPVERLRYEHIFNSVNVKMFGRILNNVNDLCNKDTGFRKMLKYINKYDKI